MSEKKECSGSEESMGRFLVVDECASSCKGISSMFAFGTNDFGTNRCYDDGCSCLCETSATEEGTCDSVNHNGYILYKYKMTTSKGKYNL